MTTQRRFDPARIPGLVDQILPGAGNIFYVDGCAGDDAYSGQAPETPLLTLTAALDLCDDDANNTILVLDYYQPATETWPVHINKSKVQIIGVPSGNTTMPWAVVVMPGDTACFSIEAFDVIVRGFSFGAGAAHGGIEFASNKGRIGIYDCRFNTGAHGVWFANGMCEQAIEVSNCYFQSSLTAQRIYLNDDPPFCKFSNNIFEACDAAAIEVAGVPAATMILDNVMALASDLAGGAITLSAGCFRSIVNGNSAIYGNAAPAINNPYVDGAAANLNHWGLNYDNGVYTLPA